MLDNGNGIGDVVADEYQHSLGFMISTIVGSPHPEFLAALGASLSRNPASLSERICDFTPEKTARIIGDFFRRYGHSSIGEMGNLFFSVEGISMVDAIHTICFPLFFGQESSTRYIDFSSQGYVLPPDLCDSTDAHRIVREWFALYQDVLSILMQHFTAAGMSEKVARPRAFDIAGGFLPIATKTSVVVCGNMRNLIEHCWEMQSYFSSPLTQKIGDHLLQVIDTICPHAVVCRSDDELVKRDTLRTVLRDNVAWYFNHLLSASRSVVSFRHFDVVGFDAISEDVFASRLPDQLLGRFGAIQMQTAVSFRSLREILRHRPFSKTWCMLTHSVFRQRFDSSDAFLDALFCPWYFEQLPEDCRDSVRERTHRLVADVLELEATHHTEMYLLPMGVRVFLEMTGGIDKWLYFLRLRSGLKVHPEVREIVCSLIERFSTHLSIPDEKFGDMSPHPDYVLRSEDA